MAIVIPLHPLLAPIIPAKIELQALSRLASHLGSQNRPLAPQEGAIGVWGRLSRAYGAVWVGLGRFWPKMTRLPPKDGRCLPLGPSSQTEPTQPKFCRTSRTGDNSQVSFDGWRGRNLARGQLMRGGWLEGSCSWFGKHAVARRLESEVRSDYGLNLSICVGTPKCALHQELTNRILDVLTYRSV